MELKFFEFDIYIYFFMEKEIIISFHESAPLCRPICNPKFMPTETSGNNLSGHTGWGS